MRRSARLIRATTRSLPCQKQPSWLANTATKQALTQAQQQRDTAERTAYIANTNLMQREYENNNVGRTLDMLDQAGSMPPMRLRPSLKVAEMMLSQQFQGGAINLGAMQAGPPMTSRKVRTE